MYILLVIPVIIVLLIAALYFILKRKFYSAVICFAIAAVLNFATQQVPFNVSAASKTEAKAVRLLEYNICGKYEYEAIHNKAFIDYIISQNADILILPENSIYYAKGLDSALVKIYPYNFYESMEKRARPEIISVFSKYPLLEVERLYDPIRNKLSQDNVRTIIDIDGKPITLYSIHAASNGRGIIEGYSRRNQELAILLSDISKRSTPSCIVAGDFNDLSGSSFIRSLQKAGLKDAWWDRGFGFGFTYVNGVLRFRLDHILVTDDIKVNRIYVDDDANYSDHLPLITDMIIK